MDDIRYEFIKEDGLSVTAKGLEKEVVAEIRRIVFEEGRGRFEIRVGDMIRVILIQSPVHKVIE